MKTNVMGWHYPAGAEHDPQAPWNQTETPDLEELESILAHCKDLEDMIMGQDALEECWKLAQQLTEELNHVIRRFDDDEDDYEEGYDPAR